MKLAIFTAFCALAVASRFPQESEEWVSEKLQNPQIQDESFRSGREYRYLYNSQLLTKIPGTSCKTAGQRIQALVSIVFKTNTQCLMQITHARIGKLNRKLPNPQQMYPFRTFESVPVSERLNEKLQLPVAFQWQKGMVKNIQFDEEEQPWSANIKRSALNMLQVNLQKQREVQPDSQSQSSQYNNPEKDSFRVIEQTMEGDCESLYTVTSPRKQSQQQQESSEEQQQQQNSQESQKQPDLVVYKSIEFNNCQKRPDIKYNWRFGSPCENCEDNQRKQQNPYQRQQEREQRQPKFLKPSTVFKYEIIGNQQKLLIKRAQSESQYTIIPYEEEGNVVVTYANATLECKQTGPIQTQIPEPNSPSVSRSQMTYTPEWDSKKELFQMEEQLDFLSQSPYSEIKNKKQMAKQLIQDLVKAMRTSVQSEAPRQFYRLVKLMRMMKESELNQLVEQFYSPEAPEDYTPEDHMKIKALLIDAIAACGTQSCVKVVLQKAEDRSISSIQAALAIKSFNEIRTVSPQMIQELKEFAESQRVRNNQVLRQSAYLTLGSMLNAMCKPNQDKLAREFREQSQRLCPEQLQQTYAQQFEQEYNECDSDECRVLILKTVSNAALQPSLSFLEKIIKAELNNPEQQSQQKQSTFVRFEAIAALRQLREVYPRRVEKILMPILMNEREPQTLRTAAAFQILQNQPPRSVIDQITRKAIKERNVQVSSFIWSYMRQVSKSSNPCEKRLATDLKLSLRHSLRQQQPHRLQNPSEQLWTSQSPFMHLSVHDQKNKLGADIKLAAFYSSRTYVPRQLYASVSPVFAGFWARNWVGASIHSEGLEDLIWNYLGEKGKFYEQSPSEFFNRRSARAVESPVQQLQKIFQSLNIKSRQFPNSQNPKAVINLMYKNQNYMFIPLSQSTIGNAVSEMIQNARFDVSQIKQLLERGQQFQIFKGIIAHEMSYKIPTSVGVPLTFKVAAPVVAKLTGQIKAQINPDNSFSKAQVELMNMKPSAAAALKTSVTLWTPVVNSGVSVFSLAKLQAPFRNAKASFDLQRQNQLKFSLKPEPQEQEIVRLETRPVTFTRVWPEQARRWVEAETRTVHNDVANRVTEVEGDALEKLIGVPSEAATGFRFEIHSRWHRAPRLTNPKMPLSPLSGPNKLSLRVLPTSQTPVEYTVRLSAQQNKNQQGRELEPELTVRKPSSQLRTNNPDVDEDEASRMRQYKTTVQLAPSIKLEIDNLGPQAPERQIVAEVKARCGQSLRLCKFESYARVQIPQHKPSKVCMRSEYLFPEAPRSVEQLQGKKAMAAAKITWGQPECQEENRINLQVLAERSQQQRQEQKNIPEFRRFNEFRNEEEQKHLFSPLSESKQISRLSELNSYKIDIDYSNVPRPVKNATQKAYRVFKQMTYWNSDINQQLEKPNPSNKIQLRIEVDASTKRSVNISIATQHEKLQASDIPLPVKVQPLSLRRSNPILSFVEQISPVRQHGSCHISSQRLQTFDDAQYQAPLSNCWTVLAKDCSESQDGSNFAVLISKKSPQSEQKKLRIISKSHSFEMSPSSEQYESVQIKSRGQQAVSCEEFQVVNNHGHEIARCEKKGRHVELYMPETGLVVSFDGYTANVQASHLYRTQTCGLCGNFNLEAQDDFQSPQQEEQSPRALIHSYTMASSKCQKPEQQSICEDEYCTPKKYEEINENIKTYRERHQSSSPIQRTQVIERTQDGESQICFSKIPIPHCGSHTYPKEEESQQKTVQYACLPRNSRQAERILFQAESQEEYVKEVRQLPKNWTRKEVFPKSCQRF